MNVVDHSNLGLKLNIGPGECLAILSRAERRLLEHINELRYGRIADLIIRDGQPVRSERSVEQQLYDK